MLKSLYIKNYALISELTIDFGSGLQIITGETGAGKSIIIGALSLILGQRADKSVIRQGDKKCVVEATFGISEYDLQDFFNDYDIDHEDNTVVRREINPGGKSRAFINDTPFDLLTLKLLGQKLVDIHSQHETMQLADNSFQMSVLDHSAGLKLLLTEYQSVFYQFRRTEKELIELKESLQNSQADQDYYQFQFDQLEKAAFQTDELNALEVEMQQLEHAEEIKNNLEQASYFLQGDHEAGNIIDQLKSANAQLIAIRDFYPKVDDLIERIEAAYIDLKDVALEMGGWSSSVEYDPQRLNFIRERIDLLYGLMQKHQVDSLEDLIRVKDEIASKLNEIDISDERIAALEKYRNEQWNILIEKGTIIHEERMDIVPFLENEINALLKDLGIPNAVFKVKIELTEQPGLKGLDQVQFLFSANKNEEPKEISKIASGGEMSRFMLSLKYVIADKMQLPTIIFDEIDAGVSGEIADKMGNILKKMASFMQVVDITHLPQVAAKADRHYFVYKKDDDQFTNTYLKLLNQEERVIEIAKMLSGEKLTDAAIMNAKQMLEF